MRPVHNIPTTTVTMFSRASTSLRGGGADEAALSITLPRITIAERRLDEAEDDRPRWKGRPAGRLPEDEATTRAAAVVKALRVRPVAPAVRIAPVVAPVAPVVEVEPEPMAPLPSAPIGALRGSARRRWRIAATIRACAEAGGVRPEDIAGERRMRGIVAPRQIAFWILSNVVGLSLSEAGYAVGDRDHTTALHGCVRVEAVLSRAGIVPTDDMEAADFARAVIEAWGTK